MAESEKPFFGYNSYIRQLLGRRLQKLSIHAGFTCPNRDGTRSRKGCAYCNNDAFRPGYCVPEKSVTAQLDEGIRFFSKRHARLRYLAYFQSYSNTYAALPVLRRLYEEALAHPLVEGLVIGTRPDCVDAPILDYIGELAADHYISLEYGIESTLDATLTRINRQHSYASAVRAIEQTKARGIHTGGHIILGLPGESVPDFIGHAVRLSSLPLDTLKIHHLQILKHTRMHRQYVDDPGLFSLFTANQYIDIVSGFLQHLRPDIAIERFVNQSPESLLVAPKWGLKNFEFAEILRKHLFKLGIWQGQRWSAGSALNKDEINPVTCR